MKKVITYGTFDLLHHGHINLLRRAKELGDYLIVGVTSSDFDKSRGKINVQQSLMERIANVEATGLADEIIIEEYEGQKIDDIKRKNIDIFTIGSDWKGKFDYLNEYCKVVYLERTKGISSSKIRCGTKPIKIGIVGDNAIVPKIVRECDKVNGLVISGYYFDNKNPSKYNCNLKLEDSYRKLLDKSDAVFIITHPSTHFEYAKTAIEKKKHVIIMSPMCLSRKELDTLNELAKANNVVVFDSIKTAYSMAYYRLLLLAKTGVIGDILSIDATCTSLKDYSNDSDLKNIWNSLCSWGPTALLPIFQILGTNYKSKQIISRFKNEKIKFDDFTKIFFLYDNATASIKVAKGAKSEGELVITGTKGYIYVPSPWWKTAYFEIRYEDQNNNRRFFYELQGEGIRYELVEFCKNINLNRNSSYVDTDVSKGIVEVLEDFYKGIDCEKI